MKIVLVCDQPAPPRGHYGGTERVVAWLAEELASTGYNVVLIGPPATDLNSVTRIIARTAGEARARIPIDADIVHFHGWIPRDLDSHPNWLMTLHGNRVDISDLPRNTVFVSQDHARRHGRCMYVYNGIKPTEYVFQEKKRQHLLFFSKVRRRVKGAREAIRLAHRFQLNLRVAGGTRLDLLKMGGLIASLQPNISFCGELSGPSKAQEFANASALIFPIRWHEPFGLVMIESLISGTPVIARAMGSVPELIDSSVGCTFQDDVSFGECLDHLSLLTPATCRDFALTYFTSKIMAETYLDLYVRVRDGEMVQW